MNSTAQTTFNYRKPRRTVEMKGFAALDDGATFAISVVDLSYDGCKIETELALLPGMRMKLSFPELGIATAASVRWYRRGRSGLVFYPEDLAEKALTVRKHDRIVLTGEILIRRSGRPQYRTRFFDMTPAGCKVEFVERPRDGETVWVKFEGLTALESTVRWVEGFSVGVEFVRPFYPSVFDLLVARMSVN